MLATYRGRTSHFTLAAKRTNKSRYHHPAPSYHRCCLNLSLSFSLSFSLPMCIYTSELILARIFSNAFMLYLKGNTGLEFLTSRKVRQGIERNNSNRFRYQWDFIKKFLRRKQQSIKFYLNRKPRLQLSVSLLIQILQSDARDRETGKSDRGILRLVNRFTRSIICRVHAIHVHSSIHLQCQLIPRFQARAEMRSAARPRKTRISGSGKDNLARFKGTRFPHWDASAQLSWPPRPCADIMLD